MPLATLMESLHAKMNARSNILFMSIQLLAYANHGTPDSDYEYRIGGP